MPQFQVISRQIPLHPLHLSSWLLSVIASWGAISLSRVLHQALKHTQTLTRLILSVISCFWLWLQHTTPYSCHARTSNLRPLSKFAESSQVVGSLCLANMWTARQTVDGKITHVKYLEYVYMYIYVYIYYIAIIHYPDIREVRGSKVNEVMILLPNHHSPGIVIVSTTFASAPGSCSVLGIPCDAERPGSWRYVEIVERQMTKPLEVGWMMGFEHQWSISSSISTQYLSIIYNKFFKVSWKT